MTSYTTYAIRTNAAAKDASLRSIKKILDRNNCKATYGYCMDSDGQMIGAKYEVRDISDKAASDIAALEIPAASWLPANA